MLSLTAVIPVATSIADLSRLKSNITDALQSDVHVVVVLDQVSNEFNPSLESLSSHFSGYGEKFQVVRGKYGSPGKARNAGKQNANTEFIAFWDADDKIKIQNIITSLALHGDKYDYIVGSYQVFDINSGLVRNAMSRKTPGMLSVIKEPGIWRMIFRSNKVGKCQFGKSFMGEDQVFLVNSGLLGSKRILFTNDVFYTYFTGVDGQLTSGKRLNLALVRSLVEILGTSTTADFKELGYRLLVALRICLTLVKRIVTGKK